MKRLVMFTSIAWLMLGCGKVSPRPAMADVNDLVRGRSGHSVDWVEDPVEFERRRETVAALLQEPLTTQTAVQIGVLNNRWVQAELEEISIAQADLVQAGLVSNPSFGIGILFAHSSEHVNKQEFSLTQDLLDFVLLSPRKKIAVNELERTKLNVATELLDFIARVKRAFYLLQSSVQLANRLKLILEINEAGADLAQKQFEAGTLNELDLANQQALYQETRASLAQEEIQIQLNREQVNRLLGLWGDLTRWEIVKQLPPIPEQDLSLPEWETIALERRLDLAASRLGVNVLRKALSLKKKTRFFPLGIEFGIENKREPKNIYLTGPTLSIALPIFDVGRASVARLEYQIRQAERQLEVLTINARADVREARDWLLSSRELARYYRETLLPQRVRILDLTQRQYNMMLMGTYDLLIAKQSEVSTERAYVETWRDYWLARTQLERAVGGTLSLSIPPLPEASGGSGSAVRPEDPSVEENQE
jgi:cobalt-zinc-cadmium efflux system outer membrane protein